jgi:hypothetical protein
MSECADGATGQPDNCLRASRRKGRQTEPLGRWALPVPHAREFPTGLGTRGSNFLRTDCGTIDANPNQRAHFAYGEIPDARPQGQESTPETVNQASMSTVGPPGA